ncbi:MAG: hypothetical protein QW254_04650, partial [Desulfurococcaceae archaeon]
MMKPLVLFLSKLKSPFYKTLMKKEEMITSELYSLIKQIYLDGYIVEKIPLNEIIETYSIKDVVKVIIGLGKDMLTYVIE